MDKKVWCHGLWPTLPAPADERKLSSSTGDSRTQGSLPIRYFRHILNTVTGKGTATTQNCCFAFHLKLSLLLKYIEWSSGLSKCFPVPFAWSCVLNILTTGRAESSRCRGTRSLSLVGEGRQGGHKNSSLAHPLRSSTQMKERWVCTLLRSTICPISHVRPARGKTTQSTHGHQSF